MKCCVLIGLILLLIVSAGCAAKYPVKAAYRMPLLMPDDFEQMNLVSWRVEQGRPDPKNPLLESKMPWDAGGVMSHGTVLHDPIDGLWKAWQISTPVETKLVGIEANNFLTGKLRPNHENERRLTYLESKDGVNWYRPKLSFVKWHGYEHTNILLSHDSGGVCTHASVIIDPDRKDWPYEMFILRQPGYDNPSGTVGHLPAPKTKRAIYRYRSKDGKNWQVFEGPFYTVPDDVAYVHKQPDKSYVIYYKSHIPCKPDTRIPKYDNNIIPPVIRVVTRSTSRDGTNWSKGQIVMEPDWRDPPDTQFMDICPLQVKGGYVGMVTVYHTILQTIDLQLAGSRDGINWWTVDRRPTLPNPPLGDYGSGMIWQMKDPIVEGNRLFIYYSGVEGIHGEIFDSRIKKRRQAREESTADVYTPTLPFAGALCRATWTYDRMWAMVPSAGGVTTGAAVTRPQACAGRQLWANINVRPRGSFEAELLDKNGRVLPGFSRKDCVSITGDHHAVQLRWKAGDLAPTEAVKVKFYLTRAWLYGFEWRTSGK